jgi:hypothetical protein
MQRGDELEIEIDATGQVRVVTHGVKGKRCLEYMEIFQEILGAVDRKELTPEYNETENTTETHTNVDIHVRGS